MYPGAARIAVAMTDHIKDLLARVAAERSARERPEPRARRAQSDLASVEREIAGEIAHSLGKAGRLLAEAIAQASATRAQLEAKLLAPSERAALVERFHQQRTLAERRLRDLLIQREALGWRNHSDVKRDYVIPPALPDE
jgi:DNA segregation ATPase FtsK/SpoIIIE-like protein